MRWHIIPLNLAILLGGVFLSSAHAAQSSAEVTFYKDAQLVFQQKCQTCHRAGQVAPFSVETYEAARPWARAIKAAIVSKKMPPGQGFSGDHLSRQIAARTLTSSELETLVSWVDGGALQGDPKHAPPPVAFTKEGWSLRPDVVIDSPIEYEIPAVGVMPWVDYLLPYKFDKDTYVAAAALVPSNPAVVHHYAVYIIPPGPFNDSLDHWDVSKPLPNAMLRKGLSPEALLANGNGVGGGALGGWTPGKMFDDRYDAYDSAVFVKAGSRLMINLHYTANGKPTTDRVRYAFEVLSGEPKNQFRFLPDMGAPRNGFILPPGDPNIKGESHILLTQDVALLSMHPHMHLRGKNWNLTATYPDGRKELLLNVPNYSFEWQLDYYPDKPVVLPAGTRIDVVGHWDNSAGNKFNPDPTAAVVMGQQNWEEMWNSLIGVAVSRDVDPRKVATKAPAPDAAN